jgi:hypothetical protein
MKDTHDDEPTRWTSIGWQALLITNRLRNQAQLTKINEEKKESTEGDPNPGDRDKQRAENERRYIDHRLKEIAAWEKKISGKR